MKILSVVFVLLISFGCVTTSGDLESTKYSNKIKQWEDLIKDPSTPILKRADAHLQLGLLYSSYKNPEKSYHKALEQIDKHLSMDPKGVENYDVMNLKSLLVEVNKKSDKEQEKREQELNNREEEIRELNKEIEELEGEIIVLKDTIGSLKQVDVELEKKRKSFK